MRRSSIADLACALVAAVIVLYALYVLRPAWLVIYVAIVLAIMFDPAVRLVASIRVGRWHPGRGLSVAAVCILVLAVLTTIVLLITPAIADELGRLDREWPRISSRTFGASVIDILTILLLGGVSPGGRRPRAARGPFARALTASCGDARRLCERRSSHAALGRRPGTLDVDAWRIGPADVLAPRPSVLLCGRRLCGRHQCDSVPGPTADRV